MRQNRRHSRTSRGESGLTLLEVLVAAFILLGVMLAMLQYYSRGRGWFDREEWKRKAVAVTQQRFEDVRRNYHFSDIDSTAVDTTMTVDGIVYTFDSTVQDETPFSTNKTVTITTRFQTLGTGETRQVVGSYIYFRGLE